MAQVAILNHKVLYWTVWDRFMQVLYLGRAPCTEETLPNFREKCRVIRHSRVFRGLTGSHWTPGFGVSQLLYKIKDIFFFIISIFTSQTIVFFKHTDFQKK